jgi:hypothetical protein
MTGRFRLARRLWAGLRAASGAAASVHAMAVLAQDLYKAGEPLRSIVPLRVGTRVDIQSRRPALRYPGRARQFAGLQA